MKLRFTRRFVLRTKSPDFERSMVIFMNPLKFLQLKNGMNRFQNNHPKFPLFLKSVREHALLEGTVIEFHVASADGKTYTSNLKLTPSDIEFLKELEQVMQEGQ